MTHDNFPWWAVILCVAVPFIAFALGMLIGWWMER